MLNRLYTALNPTSLIKRKPNQDACFLKTFSPYSSILASTKTEYLVFYYTLTLKNLDQQCERRQ